MIFKLCAAGIFKTYSTWLSIFSQGTGFFFLQISDFHPFSSRGTRKLITKNLWHTTKYNFSWSDQKNRYNFHSFTPDSYDVGHCHFFLFDNLRGKKSVALTKQSGIPCFKNYWGTPVENCWFTEFAVGIPPKNTYSALPTVLMSSDIFILLYLLFDLWGPYFSYDSSVACFSSVWSRSIYIYNPISKLS